MSASKVSVRSCHEDISPNYMVSLEVKYKTFCMGFFPAVASDPVDLEMTTRGREAPTVS